MASTPAHPQHIYGYFKRRGYIARSFLGQSGRAPSALRAGRLSGTAERAVHVPVEVNRGMSEEAGGKSLSNEICVVVVRGQTGSRSK